LMISDFLPVSARDSLYDFLCFLAFFLKNALKRV